MKYSIIIVAYKAVEQLRRCLDSINASSIEDAEIIVWDNSPEPLFQAPPEKAWSARVPICAFYNGINFGFAEACNLAAKQAKGEYLIFLNPDTEVFGDWAERMVAHFNQENPTPIGAVGPISNFVAGLQHYRIHMQEVGDGKSDMAVAAREALAGRAVATRLLIGFCIMMRADLFRLIGGMDGTLFLGCDDLDLSWRLREAGYELLIASDVFIHHEGHQSMYQNPETEKLINDTEDLFRAKLLAHYGSQEAVPTSDDLWGCNIFYTGPLTPKTLAVNLIVREEEENLRQLLPQLGFADEIVLVDTKPDRPADQQANMVDCIRAWCEEVAPVLAGKVKVGLFPWVDDFAAARNKALEMTTSDYVLWLDADDRVPEESRALLRAAMDRPGPLTAQKKAHFSVILRDFSNTDKTIEVAMLRLFPRIEGLYWEQAIHENYGDRAIQLGLPMRTVANIVIEHHGYKDAEVVKKKQVRNLRILSKQPDSPHKFMHMGNSFMAIHDHDAARAAYKALLHIGETWPGGLDAGLVAHTRYMLASAYYREFMSALDAWQKAEPEKRGAFPQYPAAILGYVEDNPKPDATFLLAEHYFFRGELIDARALYCKYSGSRYIDFFGTNQDTFHEAAERRIAHIDQILAKAGAPGVVEHAQPA